MTVPSSGASRRPSSFRSVVFPEPFGPSTPTNVPGPTSIDTLRTAAREAVQPRRPAYATETLRADSNADPDDAKTARRGIAEKFFVRPVEKVQRAREGLDAMGEAPRRPDIDHRKSRRLEEATERAERRLDVQHRTPRADFGKRRQRVPRPQHVQRALMAGAAEERIADLEWRRRGARVVDRQHFRVEGGIAATSTQAFRAVPREGDRG